MWENLIYNHGKVSNLKFAKEAIMNNDILNDRNKICQWYCCYCGKSYGTIIYKNANTNYNNITNNNYSESNSITTSFVNLMYGNSNIITTTNNLLEMNEVEIMHQLRLNDTKLNQSYQIPCNDSSDLFTRLDIKSQSSHLWDIYENELPINSTIKTSSSFSSSSSSPPSSTKHLTGSTSNYTTQNCSNRIIPFHNNTVILNTPTRYTCNRCHHMMCPYCLKVRVKDLDDANNNYWKLHQSELCGTH